MKKNLLLTPGPTQTPPELCAVLGRPIIHHRTPQFQQYLKETVDGLKFIMQTKNDICLLVGSGTAAMEAAVANLLSSGDKAIVVESGKFGERWTEICNAYGVQTHVIKIAWGKAVTVNDVKPVLDTDKSIKAVFVTHSETSTGITTDLKPLGELMKNYSAVIVADAVSGLGIMDLQTDAWGIDIVVSASHKGLMLPPGVAFTSISAKAWKFVEQSTSPRYYFDFRLAKKAWEKTDTAFTPAIGIIIAMTESLKKFQEDGLEKTFANYARLARGARAAAKGLGLEIFSDQSCWSNVLTPIILPAGIDGEKLVNRMRDTYGITVAGGQDTLKGKIIRMAHMGCIDEYDLLTGISCFEKVLHEMGYKFELGAGIAAAQKVFNS